MFRKICLSCDEISNDLNSDFCKNCGKELVFYLSDDSGFDKFRNKFSKNKNKELAIINQLEKLSSWIDFFKKLDDFDNLEDKKDFYKQTSDFREDISNYNLPDNFKIENKYYEYLFNHFVAAVKFVERLDEKINEAKALNLDKINSNKILTYIKDDEIGEYEKIEYVSITLSKISKAEKIRDIEYLSFYDDSLDINSRQLKEVGDLSNKITLELKEVDELSQYFSDFKKYFNKLAKKPSNYASFKQKIISFKYLDIAPYFYQDSKLLLDDVKDIKNTFNKIDLEQEKVRKLSVIIGNLNKDYEELISGDLHDYKKLAFLDKYSVLSCDVNSFKYLDLLKNTDDIKNTQKFFKDFDTNWQDIIAKNEQKEKEIKFHKALDEFNKKWEFLLDLEDYDYNKLNEFRQDLEKFKNKFVDFVDDNTFDNFETVFNYIDELVNEINSIDFDNFKVSTFLNYLKDGSLDDNSKVKRVNMYKSTLDKIESIDYNILLEFDSSIKIPFSDIDNFKNFLLVIDSEIEYLNSFKNDFNDYTYDKLNVFKEKIDKFQYLDILPYFDEDIKEYVEMLSEIKSVLKEIDIEINKISSIILDCTRFKLEYENNKEVLDKYSSLKEDVLSFKYLDILPLFDSNLKDFVEVVSEVQEIFNRS